MWNRMNRITPSALLASVLLAGGLAMPTVAQADEAGEASEASSEQAQDRLFWPEVGNLPTVEVADLERIVKNHGSELLVVNLWASWCAPCVAELPYFQAAHEEFKDQGVRMVGVGDDYSVYGDDWKAYATMVIERREVTYPNYQVVSDPQEVNSFFSPQWSGALPATFLYNREGEQVARFFGEVSKDQLFAAIREALGNEEAEAADGSEPG